MAGFLRAIELEPNDVTAHQWYAEMLSVQGRLPEALEQLALAEKIDPLAPIIPHIRGWIFNWDDQLEPAEEAYLAALSLDPGFPYAISNLAQVYMRTGALDMARARWTFFALGSAAMLLRTSAASGPTRAQSSLVGTYS